MSISIPFPVKPEVIYPESDGQPMAENTVQFEYIVTIKCGLEALFREDVNVFVAGDLFWYPVEGDPTLRTAPDIMAAFGRPKGHRSSYQQWLEDNIPPQVVFEIASPGNRYGEMKRKFRFYERYGVEEYYLYDPEDGELSGWLREGQELREIPTMTGWVSPRLKVRFELQGKELRLYGPDGQPFATYLELVKQRDQERQQKELAQRQLDQERQQKELAQRRLDALTAQLRALGVEPQP